jgi:hypothetical protein
MYMFKVELPQGSDFLPRLVQRTQKQAKPMKSKTPTRIVRGRNPAKKDTPFVRQSPGKHHQLRSQVEPDDVITRDEQITNLNNLADVDNQRNMGGNHSKCLLPAEIAVGISTC